MYEHMQEIPRLSEMVPDNLPDRLATCKRLTYILRRAKTVWAISGDSQTVCYSARQSLTQSKTV
ncbi:hypothetical protein DPMN_152941 [Dreissena polymorpha]|uniref:Uncharacterized protein n=1 Tax=Dreissena polymorpha TaxID=45954 RepID=A0A9D4FKI6_DREPO|nr:hypothetical protein DPMN_152941 [Dreissena polymorpha]